MSKHCTSCAGHDRHCHVYVISRADQPWSKIGTAFVIGSRMASYRAKGLVIVAQFRQAFCCKWAAEMVEFEAHRIMEQRADRCEGDWFGASVAESVEAIEDALLSPEVRQYL